MPGILAITGLVAAAIAAAPAGAISVDSTAREGSAYRVRLSELGILSSNGRERKLPSAAQAELRRRIESFSAWKSEDGCLTRRVWHVEIGREKKVFCRDRSAIEGLEAFVRAAWVILAN
jgi:hypothetical protein